MIYYIIYFNLKRFLYNYLLYRYSIKSDDGKLLYHLAYVVNVRMAKCDDGNTFLNGRCKSATKKKVHYFVNIKIGQHNMIENTNCECTIGIGSTAHCKHVLAILWAIEHLYRERKIIFHKTCMQNLQSFNQPSELFCGSPIKADDMQEQFSSVNFTPVNPEKLNAKKINE